ncbi:MAG: enoyl-CoA hydratase/isomerase family protein [Chloroflexi bacterium]|nr:enoyl-CoA hydratase/isomerase family protein [Chloroflexota bacterium]
MTYDTISFDVRDHVAWITLNRPSVLNVYNVQMRDELFEVLSAVRDDDDIRVLVLHGAGRAFCAGADLTEFGTAPSPTAARRIRFSRDNWALLEEIRIPTIAALHGFALGSGLEIALFCDLRLAAEGTQLGLPETRLGMIPAAGATQTLPRACGTAVALDLMLTGRRVDAAEALRLGLVTRVVPADRLLAEAAALALDLASRDPDAVSAVRRAIREGRDLPLAQGLRLEQGLAAAVRNRRRAPDDPGEGLITS